jgi:hypothetical protein
MNVSGDPIHCGTTGRLEARIARSVLERATQ